MMENNSNIDRNKQITDAQALFNMGCYREASTFCDWIINSGRDPNSNFQFYMLKGSSLAKMNQPDLALKCFDLILQTDPSNGFALLAKGRCYYDLEDFDSAVRYIDKGIEFWDQIFSEAGLKPEDTVDPFSLRSSMLWIKARCLLKLNRASEAATLFDKAREFNPKLPNIFYDVDK